MGKTKPTNIPKEGQQGFQRTAPKPVSPQGTSRPSLLSRLFWGKTKSDPNAGTLNCPDCGSRYDKTYGSTHPNCPRKYSEAFKKFETIETIDADSPQPRHQVITANSLSEAYASVSPNYSHVSVNLFYSSKTIRAAAFDLLRTAGYSVQIEESRPNPVNEKNQWVVMRDPNTDELRIMSPRLPNTHKGWEQLETANAILNKGSKYARGMTLKRVEVDAETHLTD